MGVGRGLLQERPLQFQHGNVRVKSWPTQFGQTIKDPPLDVQEINGVHEIPSQERSWHQKCLFYSVWVP